MAVAAGATAGGLATLSMKNALDIFNTAVGIVGLGFTIADHLPHGGPQTPATMVRIAAGQSANIDSSNLHGNQPGLGIYDHYGRQIGSRGGSDNKILDASFLDIQVDPNDHGNTAPAEYLQVIAGGNDALCISYIATTLADGRQHAWWGDVGKACGAAWHYSSLTVGASDGEDYQPTCTWIDGDNVYPNGMGIRLPDFSGSPDRVGQLANQFSNHPEYICKSTPRFRMYQHMNGHDVLPYFDYDDNNATFKDPAAAMDKSHWKINVEGPNVNSQTILQDYVPAPGSVKRSLGQALSRRSGVLSTVIISGSAQHSAKELCDSETSWGHDFVSLKEKMFCDMESKILWHICDGETTNGCFDVEERVMKASRGIRRRGTKTGTVPPVKSYMKTMRW